MNWLEILLCILYHGFREPQLIGRTATPSSSAPGWSLFRDRGDPPLVVALPDQNTLRVSGRVEGSSDTLPANNLIARIRGEYRHDFAIDGGEIDGGEEHELQATISANGIFKHKVSSFSSPGTVTGLFLPPLPTDASTTARIRTTIDVFEVGNPAPIASTTRTHFQSTHGEDCCVGNCTEDFCQLVPVIETVSLSETATLRFTPSGNLPRMPPVSEGVW